MMYQRHYNKIRPNAAHVCTVPVNKNDHTMSKAKVNKYPLDPVRVNFPSKIEYIALHKALRLNSYLWYLV